MKTQAQIPKGNKQVHSLMPTGFLRRQCACGNHTRAGGECAACKKKSFGLQTKLTVNEPGDIYEQEADQVADQVMAGFGNTAFSGAPTRITRFSGQPTGQMDMAPFSFNQALAGPGKPIEPTLRQNMEQRFGHDFSRVRVHSGSTAEQSARDMNANAYTVGHNVVFGEGRFAPETNEGRRLICHELTHIVQQNAAKSYASHIVLSEHNTPCEQKAEQPAQAIEAGLPSLPVPSHVSMSIQRDFRGDDDPIHKPLIENYRRKIGLPLSGIDKFGNPVGPTVAEIKYGKPAQASVLAEELQMLIDNATWKEIRKRVYPKESAGGIKRAKERKAGTLPELSGLGRISTLEHFATAVKAIQGTWAGLSPDDRVKKLGNAANTELVAADVPGFLTVDKQPMQFKGFFSPRQWKFVISQSLVTSNTLDNDEAAIVSNTTLHESRHAEQEFLSARFSAGVNNKDADGIVAEQQIPKVIAQKAVTNKFNAKTDPAIKDLGRRMFKAQVTDSAMNQAISHDDGLDNLEIKRIAAEAALKNLNFIPSARTIAEAKTKRDALKAQIVIVEDKYTLYRNIPYEADAHEVGDAAEQAFKGWPT